MPSDDYQLEFKLIQLRADAKSMEQDMFASIHLMYTALVWMVLFTPPELVKSFLEVFRGHLSVMSQGLRLAEQLAEFDDQCGFILRINGVNLKPLVDELRRKLNESKLNEPS